MSAVTRRGNETGKKKGKKKGKSCQKRAEEPLPGFEADAVQLILTSSGIDARNAFGDWVEYLANRNKADPVEVLVSGSEVDPLLWCVTKDHRKQLDLWLPRKQSPKQKKKKKGKCRVRDSQADIQRINSPGGAKIVRRAQRWLDESSEQLLDDLAALSSVGWAYRLSELARDWQLLPWREALQTLLRLSTQSHVRSSQLSSWGVQLVSCELPLILAYYFPEIPACQEGAAVAAGRLERNMCDLLDGQGMPSATNLHWMPLWGGCWSRSLAILNCLETLVIRADVLQEFDWFVRQCLRLIRTDGGLPFENRNRDKGLAQSQVDWIRVALKITGDAEDRELAKVVLQGKEVADHRLPDDPGHNSEWSHVAVLQSEWSPDCPRLTVDYAGVPVRAELSNVGEILFSCDWDPIVFIDGERLEPVGESWESVCWFSDFDADYLEIEMAYSGDWKIQRQFLMARQDQFLYCADNLLGPSDAKIDYRLTIPWAPGIHAKAKSETRESLVRGKKKSLGLLIPPGLPEWRSDLGGGEFSLHDGQMELRYQQFGSAMCAPLFIDLHRRRMKKPVTWRRLTVAEQLRILSADHAVGYRVHVGPEQWLVYRSLASRGNRTVLGQNLVCEFQCARFLLDGDIESLIEIE